MNARLRRIALAVVAATAAISLVTVTAPPSQADTGWGGGTRVPVGSAHGAAK